MNGDKGPSLAQRHEDAAGTAARDGGGLPEGAAPPADEGAPTETFPIVGIGASAGGLEALEAFFERVPPEPDMAFVVVQHLAPDHPSIMPELLGRRTKLPVQLAEDGARVAPNNVYVIPPNAALSIHDGVLSVKAPLDRRRPPIDAFFRSLAEDRGPNAIGVVLSGTGADGSLGVRAIKEHGGMAIAQDAETAKYGSMPRSAVAVGLVDHVLPADQMPQKLIDYMMYPRRMVDGAEERESRDDEDQGEALRKICSLLQRKTGHDFSQYKPATLVRRIRRRMQVVQSAGLSAYVERLRGDNDEIEALFRDLLIGVTQFFRDPEAFAALEAAVVPRLFHDKGLDDQVRVWVPGCATGEEAYSIAILLREHLSKIDAAPHVKIFATDIDEHALEVARLGRYPEGVAEHVTPERVERFFVKQGGIFQVGKELREMCIFSVHNLISDPPFSRLDLVSCRNVLIYLDGDIQRKLTPLFHYALRPGGHLFLGPSESLAVPDLFRAVEKKSRIFLRNDAVLSPPVNLPFLEGGRGARGLGDGAARALPGREQGLARLFDRALLDGFGPAAVVINERAEVIYTSGRTGKYLELAQGMMNLNLVDLAQRTLRPDLYTAIHKAMKAGHEIVHERVPLEVSGNVEWIDLIVRPLPELESPSKLFLVVFRDVPLADKDTAVAAAAARELDPLARVLEAELRSTKEHLQTTIEELETSNEELKSANEELQSTNEELQSTNEELQTSKEELQSINEELQTVNLELSRKVDELDRANSDLQNLFASTQIATVFLDRDLRIKKFSAAATDVFRIIDADIGRPITDIAAAYTDGNLVEDATEVLSTLRPKERQIFRADVGLRYIRRVRPYQSTDHMIDGVVVTLVDVTELTKAQERAAGLAAIVASSEDAIIGISLDGAITSWNKGAERLYGRPAAEALGQQASSLGSPVSDLVPFFHRIRAGEEVRPFEAACSREGTGPLQILVAFFPVRDDSGKVVAMASIGRDITEARVHARTLEEADRRKTEFIALLGHELRNPLVPLRNAAATLKRLGAPGLDQPAQTIERQVAQMTRLIDDLLDVARITTGKIVLRKVPLDLTALVRALVSDWQPRAVEAGVSLTAALPGDSLPILADPARITQAAGNLLHNALKFTPRGGRIAVEVERGDDARAVVRVRDSGVGMTAEVASRMFSPFSVQARSAASGGLGLGLGLAKGMVELHGGSLQGQSEGPGRGSTFTIRLPIDSEEPVVRAAPPRVAAAFAGRRSISIVLVEDNVDVAESTAALLELSGYRVSIAHTANDGIALAKREKPDVVLCDLGLPGERDGHDVARALRADPEMAPTHLVALSGFGQEADKRRAKEAGFAEHLTKPVDPDVLERFLSSLPGRG